MEPPNQNNRLTVLAGEINDGLEAIRRDATAMAERMLRIGHALVEAKRGMPRGAFDDWLATNVALSSRTARRYMRLSRMGLKTDTVAELGLVGALAPLSKLRRPLPGEVVRGQDGAGWQWLIWRSQRAGQWFHVWAFHYGLSDEIATIKPMKWLAVPGQLAACGLDMASLRFEPPARADTSWLNEQRAEIIGEAHPLWINS